MAKRDIKIAERSRWDEANLPENAKTIMKDLEFIITGAGKELSDQAKYDIVHKIAWEWTEGQKKKRKYFGCTYWSKEALVKKYKPKDKDESDFIKELEKGNECSPSEKDDKGLRHEHVVPKKLFMEYVWDMVIGNVMLDKANLKNLMNQNLLACVITADEDKVFSEYKITEKLPSVVENFDNKQFVSITQFENVGDNTWNRYKIAQQGGLSTIYKVEWDTNDTKKIKKITQFLPKP